MLRRLRDGQWLAEPDPRLPIIVGAASACSIMPAQSLAWRAPGRYGGAAFVAGAMIAAAAVGIALSVMMPARPDQESLP